MKRRVMIWAMVVAGAASFALDAGGQTAAPAAVPKVKVLLLTGMDYPGHLWRETAPVLAQGLREDKRLEVFTVEDPDFLESPALHRYEAVVLHFKDWEQRGPGPEARENLRKFVADGKGVVLLHFACGLWHKEWPEFEKIAGRVWFGQNPPDGRRQHDPRGKFKVQFPDPKNPIVAGMADFETDDELYTCLIGAHPIQVIAQAKSPVDGKDYPIAFVSNYGKGRTFHCVLGHDARALSVPSVQELFRRGCAWAAGLPASEGRK